MNIKSKGRTWGEAAASQTTVCALVFKARLCGYTGPYTHCDKRIETCMALDNVQHYAGLPEPQLPTIQDRVMSLGLLVHTVPMVQLAHPYPQNWAAYDWRTYDGTICGSGATEEEAILDLLSLIENQRYEAEDLP